MKSHAMVLPFLAPILMLLPIGASASPWFDAAIESATWCSASSSECYGTEVPFEICLDVCAALPETLDVSRLFVELSWVPHYLELLDVRTADVWDTTEVEIENPDGRARITCISDQPGGARLAAGDLMAAYTFWAERPGNLPYWVSDVEMLDGESLKILPDTTAGTLGGSYCFKLGDFTEDVFGGYSWSDCPDRRIDVYDVSVFSIHFGLVDSDSLFDCRVDIGPTFTGWIHGVPEPDGVIDYDDLAIFSDSYTYEPDGGIAIPATDYRNDWALLRASVVEALESRAGRSAPERSPGETADFAFVPQDTNLSIGDSVWIDVRVAGNVAELKTYEILAVLDPSVLVLHKAQQGSLFFNLPGDSFFRSQSAGDTLEVLDSALGAGLYAGGPGTVVRFLFEAVGPGTSPLHFLAVRAADVEGLATPTTGADGSVTVEFPTEVADAGSPALSGDFLTARPNPFAGRCVLGLPARDARSAGDWEIKIFDVRGRLVRNLRMDLSGPAPYEVEWDGRDEIGRSLPSGIYFAIINEPGEVGRWATKILLSK